MQEDFEGAPGCPLFNTDQYIQSITNRGIGGKHLYSNCVGSPYGRFFHSVCLLKYIHQTMLLHREGTIKTRFKC